MDHLEAVKQNAVEKYLLGDLTVAERDAFEEHYFVCVECAADVKAGAAFVDNAREVMRRAPANEIVAAPAPAKWGWFGWLRPQYAMGAIAVLVLMIGYQNLVTIPRMKNEVEGNTAQALPTFSLVTSGTRGAGDATEIAVQRNRPFGIYVDIPGSDRFQSYTAEVRTKEGRRKLNIEVSAAQAKDAVQLFIPGGTLSAGAYDVVVVGNKSADGAAGNEEVVRHGFVVRDLP